MLQKENVQADSKVATLGLLVCVFNFQVIHVGRDDVPVLITSVVVAKPSQHGKP